MGFQQTKPGRCFEVFLTFDVFSKDKKSRDCLYFFFLGTRSKHNFECLSFENTSKIRNTSKQRHCFVCQIEKAC